MFVDSVTIHHKNFPARDRYPFNLKVLRKTDRLVLRSKAVFFVGENGSGKSTLMEAIARRFGLTVWGGEKTHIVHRNPYETRLYDFLTLEGDRAGGSVKKGFLFRAENFFNYASYIDDMILTDPGILDYYGGESLHRQSHGQGFLSFFENRCRLDGVYLLDEPEAALSPRNQLTLLKIVMKSMESGTKQFIISTHSPVLLGLPGAQILSFDQVPIRQISYEETSSYLFYKRFLKDRERCMEELDR